MQPSIIVTEAASRYIEKMLTQKNGIGFRLSIKKTGCSGYSYAPTIIEAANTTDVLIQSESGLKIYVDSSWLHLLNDLRIDYIEDEKSGLKQKRLVFTNPNEESRCGCGESFHVK